MLKYVFNMFAQSFVIIWKSHAQNSNLLFGRNLVHYIPNWVHSFEMSSNFRISKNLEDRSSNFPNFRKALFQFRILLWKVRKTIFRCLIFLGKVRFLLVWLTLYFGLCALSPRISSIQKIFYVWSNSEIR